MKPWLLLVYAAASLLHFAHNAEYLAYYPNLPSWFSRVAIYLAWLAILSIGIVGYLLFRRGLAVTGLTLLTVYTALGFGGLLHYGRAPMSAHTVGMNLTIWLELAAASAALGQVLLTAASLGRVVKSGGTA